MTELKKRSADCEFSQLRDSLIRDIVICGIIDNRLRERLLREPDLSLEKTLQLGHAAEETKRHIKELQKQNETKAFVDGVKKKHSAKSKPKFTSSSSGYDKSFIKNCKFCASSHKRGNCNAYGKKNVETVSNLITLQNVVHQALKQSNMLNATLQILMKIMQLIIHFLLEVLLLILQ